MRHTVPNQLPKAALVNNFRALITNGVGSESPAGTTWKRAWGRGKGIFLFLIGGGCPPVTAAPESCPFQSEMIKCDKDAAHIAGQLDRKDSDD
jgi:hypothetical protein